MTSEKSKPQNIGIRDLRIGDRIPSAAYRGIVRETGPDWKIVAKALEGKKVPDQLKSIVRRLLDV